MKQLFRISALALIMFFTSGIIRATEGMWLLQLLQRMNEAEMKQMGLNLTAEEIYSINNASLKDAIVRLNGGLCTGEVISGKGLVLTNHHCGYDAIQSFATVENDILTNGFMAKNLAEEKPMEGFVISFLVRIEDVTQEILSKLNDSMSEADRNMAIMAASGDIEAKFNEGGKYEVEVKSFFYGNEFYVMIYETFRDIRLVGNPPESIGKYGGDTDNWMWPRHTGDFSMMRIYANAANEPADYATDNVPYKPKHSLPVSLDGVKEGDFAMILGFPGSTDRYLTSWGVKQAVDLSNPAYIDLSGLKLETWKKHMDADPAVRLQYAAKYATTANGWKYFIGQTKGLKQLDVQGKKEKLENEFTTWVNANAERKQKYGEALNLIKQSYSETDAGIVPNSYAVQAGLLGAEITLFAWRFNRTFEAAMNETDEEKRKEIFEGFKGQAEAHFKDYDMATDKDVFVALLTKYYNDIPEGQQPSWMATVRNKFKGNLKLYADQMFAKSFMADKNKLYAFMAKPSKKVFDKDMAIAMAKSSIDTYRTTLGNPAQDKYDKGYRLLVAGLREMQPTKNFYPDANSTMRLTYGKVDDYYPMDAVHYDYYTTADGIMQKRDNTNPEFIVPDRQAELIEKKDFGRYANEKGELPTCFISGNDITGGNSGSPVIDGNGHLIGLAFDGNWEAMSGDIAYETDLQRTISVDIRYVMWVVDKYYGAKNLIDEIKFVQTKMKGPTPAANVKAQVETK
ncbi:MAG: S46 family peptidase [Flavobacteriales bacterium]|nr:S46 family peptidase [Flavobacteriales bacterium]